MAEDDQGLRPHPANPDKLAFICSCGRAQSYAPAGKRGGVTAEEANGIGWRRINGEWNCPFCTGIATLPALPGETTDMREGILREAGEKDTDEVPCAQESCKAWVEWARDAPLPVENPDEKFPDPKALVLAMSLAWKAAWSAAFAFIDSTLEDVDPDEDVVEFEPEFDLGEEEGDCEPD